jgi:hypothetical protein
LICGVAPAGALLLLLRGALIMWARGAFFIWWLVLLRFSADGGYRAFDCSAAIDKWSRMILVESAFSADDP